MRGGGGCVLCVPLRFRGVDERYDAERSPRLRSGAAPLAPDLCLPAFPAPAPASAAPHTHPRRFCAQVSIDTSSIQYESDALMHSMFGSDYAIACCVSAMRLGKDMQVRAVHAALPTCGAAHFCLVLRCAAPLVPPPAARCSRVGVGRLPPAVPFFSSPQKQQQQRRECTPRHPHRRRRRLPQFFGARANLAKLLLYSLNSGVDEVTGKQVGPRRPPPALNADGSLNYEAVLASYDEYMGWLAEVYANTMNVIHYMHDKCVGAGGRAGRGDGLAWFWRGLRMAPLLLSLAAARAGKGAGVPGSDAASPLTPPPPARPPYRRTPPPGCCRYDYERLQMALHDTYVRRLMAYGMAGLSVVADSLSAIKYGKVFPIYDDKGLMVDFRCVRAASGAADAADGAADLRRRGPAWGRGRFHRWGGCGAVRRVPYALCMVGRGRKGCADRYLPTVCGRAGWRATGPSTATTTTALTAWRATSSRRSTASWRRSTRTAPRCPRSGGCWCVCWCVC